MRKLEKTFKLKNFGKDTILLDCKDMGIVVEKQRLMICAYVTNSDHSEVYAAMPLSTPCKMRGLEFKVVFHTDTFATIQVADLRIIIDYERKKCSNSKDLNIYGSEFWGEIVDLRWNKDFDKYFK